MSRAKHNKRFGIERFRTLARSRNGIHESVMAVDLGLDIGIIVVFECYYWQKLWLEGNIVRAFKIILYDSFPFSILFRVSYVCTWGCKWWRSCKTTATEKTYDEKKEVKYWERKLYNTWDLLARICLQWLYLNMSHMQIERKRKSPTFDAPNFVYPAWEAPKNSDIFTIQIVYI